MLLCTAIWLAVLPSSLGGGPRLGWVCSTTNMAAEYPPLMSRVMTAKLNSVRITALRTVMLRCALKASTTMRKVEKRPGWRYPQNSSSVRTATERLCIAEPDHVPKVRFLEALTPRPKSTATIFGVSRPPTAPSSVMVMPLTRVGTGVYFLTS